ncbi:unnamed protein product, partial [Coregonus sp. 'balchen']
TSELFFWEDPCKAGIKVSETDGTKYFHGPGTGTPVFLAHGRAKSRDFIKGETQSSCSSWRDTVTTALIASFSMLGDMLVVTVDSLACVKRSTRTAVVEETGASQCPMSALVCFLPASTKTTHGQH